MKKDWKKAIESNYEEISKYNYLGLRATRPDEKYKVGDYARNSYDWDFQNDCSSDTELDGTCTVSVDNSFLSDAADLIMRIESTLPGVEQYYYKGHIVLLGGHSESKGDDDGESVIQNARVLAIIK